MRKIKKLYESKTEAEYYTKLFNSFPLHIKAISNKNSLIYKYIDGSERYDIAKEKKKKNYKLFGLLGNILGEYHFGECKIKDNYANICNNKGLINGKNIFVPSNYYVGKIHGDLHLRNIIISGNNISILDRTLLKGDILRDFPFIMSLLCFWIESGDKIYIEFIYTFFEKYINHIVGKPSDFFISFRNNFINYGLICVTIAQKREDFPERRYGKDVSNMMKKIGDFWAFIQDILNDRYSPPYI